MSSSKETLEEEKNDFLSHQNSIVSAAQSVVDSESESKRKIEVQSSTFLPQEKTSKTSDNLNAGKEFKLLKDEERFNMLDDLFESDNCYFHSSYGIELGKPKKKSSGLWKNIKNKFTLTSESFAWDEIIERIEASKDSGFYTTQKIDQLITAKGIPMKNRQTIWKFLIGNELRINRKLFTILLDKAVKVNLSDSLIKKDIDRTFAYFGNSPEFTIILKEASILLQMFVIFRHDLKYIQGMSYVMVMLLLVFRPYGAFKCFCNLVVGKKILFDCYSFKKKAVSNIHNSMNEMVAKNFPNLFNFFKTLKVEMWNIFWVEWLYAMFLRTFDLKTCYVLWDLMLVKTEFFIFKLVFVVCKLLNERLEELNAITVFEKTRLMIISNAEWILKEVVKHSDYDFDSSFTEKNVHRAMQTFSMK